MVLLIGYQLKVEETRQVLSIRDYFRLSARVAISLLFTRRRLSFGVNKNPIQTGVNMQEGAFAMLDCLGWKGIWKKHEKNPEAILDKISKVKDLTYARKKIMISGLSSLNIPVEPQIVFLSDTVLISVPCVGDQSTPRELLEGASIEMACFLAAHILMLFIDTVPHLTLRGVITFGAHSIKDTFILGPAVDEAAELYEMADGAFVWIHPEADDKLNKLYEARKTALKNAEQLIEVAPTETQEIANTATLPVKTALAAPIRIKNYQMPLKSGRQFRCSVINPLVTMPSPNERSTAVKNAIESFDKTKIDVHIKREHTAELLIKAEQACSEFYKSGFDRELLETAFGLYKRGVTSSSDA